jgi:hypothetical protein
MEIYNLLSKEIQIIIDEYNVVHRTNMNSVLNEMLYNASYVCCNNEICEKMILKAECITTMYIGTEYCFCNDDCNGYGMWSIRYDYRKKRRRYI